MAHFHTKLSDINVKIPDICGQKKSQRHSLVSGVAVRLPVFPQYSIYYIICLFKPGLRCEALFLCQGDSDILLQFLTAARVSDWTAAQSCVQSIRKP